ncbi:hypothetical protein BC829DRAFT_404018 [Chytridium lagenaria]|nr:hypothetical protein BC829DRAFT_404018 [Chytridium lagenaria]
MIVGTVGSFLQAWVYGDTDPFIESLSAKSIAPRIPLLVSRIEAVGTHPDYRSRGLVEKQFDVHHTWADVLKADITYVTGLRGYYRRFGYELAPALFGGRSGYPANIPKLKPIKNAAGEQEPAPEPYTIRPATVDDAPFITELDRINAIRRRHLTADADEAWWRNMIAGRRMSGSFNKRDIYIIEISDSTANDSRVGFFQLQFTEDMVVRYEITSTHKGHSWSTKKAESSNKPIPEHLPDTWAFTFLLPPAHPVFTALRVDLLMPRIRPEYRMYTRFVDLPRYLSRISPVLTYRLQASPVWRTHTMTLGLCINHGNVGARGGSILNIDSGVVSVEKAPLGVSLEEVGWKDYFGAGGGTLMGMMLMGLESATELGERYPADVEPAGVSRGVLDCLFPGKNGVNTGEVYALD